MDLWRFIQYYILFGWLFDDSSTVTKEDTVDDYCSDESPYRDYGSPSMSDEDNEKSYRDTYDTVEDDWNCSRNSCVSDYSSSYSSLSDSSYSSSSSDF